MIKLWVNETKWSSLLARTRALILYILVWIFVFGPEKLPGLSRDGPQVRKRVWISGHEVWKVWKNDIFRSEIGSGFGEPGATLPPNLVPRAFPLKNGFLRERPWGRGWLPPRIPRSTPPGFAVFPRHEARSPSNLMGSWWSLRPVSRKSS